MDSKYTKDEFIEGEYKVIEEREVERPEAESKSSNIIFSPEKIVLSYALFGINIAIWILMSLFGMILGLSVSEQLNLFGAKVNELIIAGQYWRLITPMFLHVNMVHLFFNSYALYIYGPIVEKLYGRPKFLLIYLLSGTFGTFLSFLFNPSPAAGASGAIFGLMGAILFLRQYKKNFYRRAFGPGLVMIIAINLIFGLTQPRIDNWGHIGGLIGGYALGSLLGLYGDKVTDRRKITLLLSVLVVALLGYFYIAMQ